MLKTLTAIAITGSLAVPLSALAQTDSSLSGSSQFNLLAQSEVKKGQRRAQRRSETRRGSRRVNKPIPSRRGRDASNRQRPPRNGVNQRRPRISNGTRENARSYIRNQRRHNAQRRAQRRARHTTHRRNAIRHRHWHAWRGHTVNRLPGHRSRYVYRGSPYFFFNNLWYRSHSAGFIVVAPPFGLVIPFLPGDYDEVVVRNRTYLRSNGIYYSRVDDGYAVVEAPDESIDLNSLPDMPRLRIATLENQSEAQRDQDKVDCHLRAVDQSGYDPRIEGGGVSYNNYLRSKRQYREAISECLEDRAYRVS